MSTEEQIIFERERSHSNLVGHNPPDISCLKLNLLPFVPLVSLETSHSQTLLGHFIKSADFNQAGRQTYLTLPDGDQLGLKIYDKHPSGAVVKNAVVTLFHGLGGNHASDYMQRSAQVAFDLGYTVVMVDHRGAGLVEGLAKKPYHSGRGEDASEVSLKLRQLFPEKKQIFVGFSMSGSILLNLITRKVGQHLPDYGIIVNAPIDLYKCSRLLVSGLSRLYDLRFYLLLKKIIKKSDPSFSLPIIAKTRFIDDVFTSKRSGFIDSLDYYSQCSTYAYLNHIAIPTFVLTSKDDPFIAFEDYASASWNRLTHRTFVDHGGHMGYVSKHKSQKHGIRWMDDYLHKVLLAIESL